MGEPKMTSERAREIGHNTFFTKENAREMQRRGVEAKKKKKEEKEGLQQLAYLVKEILKKPVKLGNVTEIEDVTSLLELTNTNMTAAATGVARMILGFVNGDKRSTQQIIELLALIQEEHSADDDDGFLEALEGSAGSDWSDEDE